MPSRLPGCAIRADSGRSEDLMSCFALNPFVEPAVALTMPEWYVSIEGSDPVGPVSADQIARGIKAGKLSSDAQLTRAGDTRWEDVLDSAAVLAALKAI
jgi:GYF domain 2